MRPDHKPPVTVEVSRYLGYGLTWALSTLLFLWLGTVVDKWLGTKPALTLIGAFVGAAAGFYYMIRNLVNQDGERGRDRDGDGEREK